MKNYIQTLFTNMFLKHPQEENMTYFQHFKRGILLSSKMAYGSICLLVHTFVPGLFQTTGSNTINQLYAITNKRLG